MIIDLIRHTKPDVAHGVCYGQADLELADSFPDELKKLKNKTLPNYDRIISSPLLRCKKLALQLSTQELTFDPRIMEYDFGEWELMKWSDIHGSIADTWMNNFVEQPAPNGESLIRMQSRVLEFWNELLSQNHKHIAIITHSGVQRIIHAHTLMTPLEHIFRLELNFGHVIRITQNSQHGSTTLRHL